MQWGIPQNIARIDRGFHHGAEIPANHHISTRSISGRYFRERSVSIPWQSITHGSTDRKKVLQTGALMGGAVDAVGTLTTFIRDIVLLSAASSPTRALQSRLERVCSRGEDSRGPWGLTGSTSLQSSFYAHLDQADWASGKQTGGRTPTTPPPYQRPEGVPRIGRAHLYAGGRYMWSEVWALSVTSGRLLQSTEALRTVLHLDS